MKERLRVGDLVTYSAERQELGVFLGELQLTGKLGPTNSPMVPHNTYWNVTLRGVTSTLQFLNLLRRVDLPAGDQ
jgi:hypothetical protein